MDKRTIKKLNHEELMSVVKEKVHEEIIGERIDELVDNVRHVRKEVKEMGNYTDDPYRDMENHYFKHPKFLEDLNARKWTREVADDSYDYTLYGGITVKFVLCSELNTHRFVIVKGEKAPDGQWGEGKQILYTDFADVSDFVGFANWFRDENKLFMEETFHVGDRIEMVLCAPIAKYVFTAAKPQWKSTKLSK
jgi:hypothetical protein